VNQAGLVVEQPKKINAVQLLEQAQLNRVARAEAVLEKQSQYAQQQ